MNQHLFVVMPLLVALVCAPLSGATDGSEITHCVQVQPFILRGDDGREPANFRLAERLIDQVYATAGIDFVFHEPIYHDHTDARDGNVSLDDIVTRCEDGGLLRSRQRRVNLFFVNAVDGRAGPLGRARTPGWIVFIALGDQPDDHRDAFVVAHEIGHNLGLQHAVDDARVADDVPNLMGDGPFEKRLAASALTPYQVDVIRKSPLVRKRTECLSLEEARRAILDDSYGGYFSLLQRREIAALTGATVDCEDLEACRDEARRRFAEAVLPFTEREEEAIGWYVEQIRRLLGQDYPLLATQPWWFVKTKNSHCDGFPHTRAGCIFLPEDAVSRIVEARLRGDVDAALRQTAPLFVHEQMHVLQRFHPRRFADLYERIYGLRRADVGPHRWLDTRQIANPDALDLGWLVPSQPDTNTKEDLWYWPRTLLRGDFPVPRMGRDMWMTAVHVQQADNAFEVVVDGDGVPVQTRLQDVTGLGERFPVQRGLDHPNEIAAYSFQQIFVEDYLGGGRSSAPGGEPQRDELGVFRRWCRANLR